MYDYLWGSLINKFDKFSNYLIFNKFEKINQIINTQFIITIKVTNHN